MKPIGNIDILSLIFMYFGSINVVVSKTFNTEAVTYKTRLSQFDDISSETLNFGTEASGRLASEALDSGTLNSGTFPSEKDRNPTAPTQLSSITEEASPQVVYDGSFQREKRSRTQEIPAKYPSGSNRPSYPMYPPLGTLGPYGNNWFPEEYKNNYRNTDRFVMYWNS